MGVMDKLLMMCDGTAVGTGTTAAKIGSAIDLKTGYNAFGDARNPDIGEGGNLFLNVICTTAFTSGGTPATATIHLRTADNDAGTSNAIDLIVRLLPNQHDTALGEVIFGGAIPAGTVKRYLMIFFGTNVAMTAGNVSAWVELGAPTTLANKK